MAATGALISIDGTHGEGGGALVRTALAMSALTQQPVRINDVRGGTRYPGLDAEDLTYLNALARSCNAEVTGAEVGSNQLSFLPTTRPRGFNGDLQAERNEGNRGPNANVVLASLLPVLAQSGVYSSVTTHGETFGTNSLSYDYFANVTIPALRRIGLYAFPDLVTAGFGRESAGTVSIDVEPSALTGIDWRDRGRLQGVKAVVATSNLPDGVGERAVGHLRKLGQNVGVSIDAQHIPVGARGPGIFVTTWATYERAFGGGGANGGRGIRAETLAQLAFEELFDWMQTPATVDPYLADHILLPLVFAEGESTFTVSRLSPRFLTEVWVVKQFTPIHLTVRGSEGGPGTITIQR